MLSDAIRDDAYTNPPLQLRTLQFDALRHTRSKLPRAVCALAPLPLLQYHYTYLELFYHGFADPPDLGV